jgi:hypothetical protein
MCGGGGTVKNYSQQQIIIHMRKVKEEKRGRRQHEKNEWCKFQRIKKYEKTVSKIINVLKGVSTFIQIISINVFLTRKKLL